jgi:tetratricopeptide (TPR) repeat protein
MLYLRRAFAARQRGAWDEAVAEAEHAVELDPLSIPAWADLIAIQGERGDRAALDDVLARALASIPRRRSELSQHASAAYEQMGDLLSALRLMRTAIPSGPFRNPAAAWKRLRALEQRVESADPG